MKDKKEIWSKIDTINGKIYDFKYNYYISMTGKVRRGDKELSPYKGSTGYLFVDLKIIKNGKVKRKSCQVHRLVAEYFIPNKENKPEVNHENGIKTKNWYDNLSWVTREENIQHAFRTGLMTPKYGEDNHKTTLTDHEVHKICKSLSKGLRDDEIINKYDFLDKSNLTVIRNIRQRKTWKHISSEYIFNTKGKKKSSFSEKEIYDICLSIHLTSSINKIIDDNPCLNKIKDKKGLIREVKKGLRYKRIFSEVQRLEPLARR